MSKERGQISQEPKVQPMLSIREVASQLSLERKTVWRYVKTGKIQGYWIGRRWRFRQEDIDSLLISSRPKRPEMVLLGDEIDLRVGIDQIAEAIVSANDGVMHFLPSLVRAIAGSPKFQGPNDPLARGLEDLINRTSSTSLRNE